MLEASVLIVDDCADFRNTIRAFLELFGYRVLEAEDGAQALEILKDGVPVKLVISDLNMPHMSGIELLRHMKEQNFSIPVILVSGDLHDEVFRKATAQGARACLQKPFSLSAFMELIRQFI